MPTYLLFLKHGYLTVRTIPPFVNLPSHVLMIENKRHPTDDRSTADVAANSPRFRRKSSTFVDAIHDLPQREEMAPAQLYSTESGRLFHSGKIAIATVGLPARGKT